MSHLRQCNASTAIRAATAPTSPPTRASKAPGSSKHVLYFIANGTMPCVGKGKERAAEGFPLTSSVDSPGLVSPHTILKEARRGSMAVPRSVPGPFMFLKRVQSSLHGTMIAARELDDAWLRGESGRIVCMKVFRKRAAYKRDLYSGIVQEILAYRNLARASSRNPGRAFVMDLDAALQDETRLFFVMELMDCDLLAVMNGHRFPRRSNAPRWIWQMASGISAIHDAGVIHRDIKPENVLVDPQGNVRIADFGAAYVDLVAHPLDPYDCCTSDVTGTWSYMAPEVLFNRKKPRCERRPYGPPVDYWSLGCVAYELLSDEASPLFASEQDMCAFLTWRGPDSFPLRCGLDQNAQCLVSGLTNIEASKRFGIKDLRGHPFFCNKDQAIEIDSVIRPIRERRRLSHIFTEDPQLGEQHREIFTPTIEGEHPFEHFGWVNPKGIWADLVTHRPPLTRP